MNFNLKKPCSNCPFRRDSMKGWLGEDRAQEISHDITTEQKTFSCHKTNDLDENGDIIETKKTEYCAGALILLEKLELPNQMMRIAERLGIYNRHGLDMDVPSFAYEKVEAANRRRIKEQSNLSLYEWCKQEMA